MSSSFSSFLFLPQAISGSPCISLNLESAISPRSSYPFYKEVRKYSEANIQILVMLIAIGVALLPGFVTHVYHLHISKHLYIHLYVLTYFCIYLLKTMSSHWKFQSNSVRYTLSIYILTLLRTLASILLNYLISSLMLPSFQFHLFPLLCDSLFCHPSHTQTSFFLPLLSTNTVCQTTLCMDALFIPLGIYTESTLSYLVFIIYTELSVSIDTLLTLLVL